MISRSEKVRARPSWTRARIWLAALAALLTLSALSAVGSAQGACRSPTDAEQATITRAQEIARQVVEAGVKDSPWQLGEWQSEEVVARSTNAPRAPIELCNDFVAVKLTLRSDSDQAHMLDSIAAASQRAMQGDGSSAAKAATAMFDAIASKTVSLRLSVNEGYLFSPRLGKPTDVVAVAGVPFATREITHASDGTTSESMELYLGDFAKAKEHITSKEHVMYPFRHPKGPYFENLAIMVESTPNSVDDVVRRIDWSKLAGVLTP